MGKNHPLPTSDDKRLRAAWVQFSAAVMRLAAAVVQLVDHYSGGNWW